MSDKMEQKNSFNLANLRKLIDTRTREEIATALKCDTSLITKHYNDQRVITVDYLIKYAEYFNVSVDFLLHKTPTECAVDTEEGMLIRKICDYTGLSEEAIEELHETNTCMLPVEMDYLSDFIKIDLFGLIEVLSAYDVSLDMTTKTLRYNIRGLQEAIDKEDRNFDRLTHESKYFDRNYAYFLLLEKLKGIVSKCFVDMEKQCNKAEKEEKLLFRQYMKEVNNANHNEEE